MKQKLIPTTVYVQPAIKRAVREVAKRRRCTDAEVIREALAAGLKDLQNQQETSIAGLKALVKFADTHVSEGPRDLSQNLDKYLWDEAE